MMNNNWEKLKIMLSLKYPFDYESFRCKCIEQGIEPLGVLEYSQKVGIIQVAIKLYPDNTLEQAYLRLLREHSHYEPVGASAPVGESVQPVQKPCNGCGGGTVR